MHLRQLLGWFLFCLLTLNPVPSIIFLYYMHNAKTLCIFSLTIGSISDIIYCLLKRMLTYKLKLLYTMLKTIASVFITLSELCAPSVMGFIFR